MLTEEIGPYRIEEQLGAGGMGEVYRAYDTRLDRRVAIKVIRPDSTENLRARERFRREARAAAGLGHPSVVQIYDILERDEGDCIVMELVEGETLAHRLEAGSLDLPRAVRFAREIAEGLAAAHGKGIIHRDLKAENVMITPEGRVKILDFGLAKRLLQPASELTLSIEGRVVGTGYAMSPEQAQGFPLDHRSDLFSFGSLLYEMLTRESPFRRPALAETLTRICVYNPPPVRQLAPAVPAALSTLIDRLLEKRPERRPQRTDEVVTVLRNLETAMSAAELTGEETILDIPLPLRESLASRELEGAPEVPPRSFRRRWGGWLAGAAGLLAVLLGIGGGWLRPAPADAISVAVPEPKLREGSGPGEGGLGLVSSGVRVALLQGLLSLEGVSTLAPDQVDAVTGTSLQVARAVAADEVVTATLDCARDRCQVTLHRVQGADGHLLWTDTFQLPTDNLLLLSTTVGESIRRGYGDHRRRGALQLEVSREDFESFLHLREAFLARQEGVTLDRLLADLKRLRGSSPRFLPAYLLEASVARTHFLESRDEADLKRAFEVIEAARRLDPDDPQPLFSWVDAALDGHRLEIAETALEELTELVPTDPQVQAHRAVLLERRGRPAEALAEMREATHRRPSSKNLLDLANMEIRHGEMGMAREHLGELLERNPGSFVGRYLLAQIELISGSPQRAAELYEELLSRSPESPVLTNLGIAYLLQKRFQPAAEVFRRAWEQEPRSPFAALNLADAELLAEHSVEAEALYRRVLELVAADPARSGWQMLTVRAQALAHLGADQEAVTVTQEALQTAPDNPQAAFEAAVVYALVGEHRSALANVQKALELGFEPVWFGFPWFDSLRQDPYFQSLLEAAAEAGGS